ncbi:MAG: hypothetical protein KDD39_01345 [Bdellovibrionales bacterium]|nr:hypothetical protein [Bdellovibrionales bacterium]
MNACELKVSRAALECVSVQPRRFWTTVVGLTLLLGFLFGLALKLSEKPVVPLDNEPFSRPHYSLGKML